MKNKLLVSLVAFSMSISVFGQTWIWYPGDFEIWLGNKMNNRRTERGTFFPPFWKTDSHYIVVEFSKEYDIPQNEEIFVAAEGRYNVKLDGKLQFGMPSSLKLPAGKHKINIKVWNQYTPPTIFVSGKNVNSDSSWNVTYEDKEWIDESGRASDTSSTIYVKAGSWNFDSKTELPSQYSLLRKIKNYVSSIHNSDGILYDFGSETFGYLSLIGLKGEGDVNIYYGESKEEALDKKYCETLDLIRVTKDSVFDVAQNFSTKLVDSYTLKNSKAFRYVYVCPSQGITMKDVSMEYEYSSQEYKGLFECNDKQINEIWKVAAYTMHLTTREFFIDGIKRDRWVWSGDAIQSYLMNYYLFNDLETVKRTIWFLRGKDPVTSHTNTIMDYTFFWFLSIYDYYLYSGDKNFVEQIYPRMLSMMEFVLGRTNSNGMIQGQSGDWVFVDWADGYMDKKGVLSFEQVLLCKSLETMALCSEIANDKKNNQKYNFLASSLRSKIIPTFWNDNKSAIVHSIINEKQSDDITRYSNMFAVFFNYLDHKKSADIKKSVLLNDSIMKITTPYMRFYELEALCALGEQKNVLKEIKDYWGGMLNEGATSFWEKYNPNESGVQHLQMYGRPYGKSLCHAWGASPIYLLGKYFLGVKPLKPGYAEYEISPTLGGLKWMMGDVPTPFGKIHVYMDNKVVRVKSDGGSGILNIKLKSGKIKTLSVEPKKEIIVKY